MPYIYLVIIILTVGVSDLTFAQDNNPFLFGKDLPKSEKLYAKPKVLIKKIRITGSTVFSEDELARVTAPYENKEISFEELQLLKQELTLYYVNRGYINSGVIIPDQEIVDDMVTLSIIEGTITDIGIEGHKHFRSGYFRKRLARASQPPVNINHIQEALQILQQDTRLQRINAELSPGLSSGEAILNVKIAEESPYRGALSFGNTQSPSVGAYRGEIMLAHLNLLGFGDTLDGRFGLTEGTSDYALGYAIPLTARDLIFKTYYRNNESTVVEETFKRLDIESRSDTFGMSLNHPVYRTPAQEFDLGLSGEVRRNETFLLGRPFSFSDVDDNVTHATAIRFSQDWAKRGLTQVVAVRSNFTVGIGALNGTISDTGSDGRFFSWLGQMQWIRQITEGGAQLVFRTDAQLTPDSLLPMEKFSVGGMNSVRGYRENALVRDNGVVSSLEMRIPIIQYKKGLVQFVPFADFGWSWNTHRETPSPQHISSLGAGFRWAVLKGIFAQLYVGHALRNIKNSDHDLQDEGVHFQVSWQMF